MNSRNLFIYLFEEYGALSERVLAIREKMLERGDQLLTSALTLGELLVKPMEKGASALCKRYEQALVSSAILLPFDVNAPLFMPAYAPIAVSGHLKQYN
jgi:hypothetical protein